MDHIGIIANKTNAFVWAEFFLPMEVNRSVSSEVWLAFRLSRKFQCSCCDMAKVGDITYLDWYFQEI